MNPLNSCSSVSLVALNIKRHIIDSHSSLIVLLNNWNVESLKGWKGLKTFSKTSGTLSWKRSLFFFAFELLLIFLREFLHNYPSFESSGISSTIRQGVVVGLNCVFNFLIGISWILQSNLRNCFCGVFRNKSMSPTSFLFFRSFFLSTLLCFDIL